MNRPAPLNDRSDLSCEIEVRVRYAETDRMGYLHHSRHAQYMEMGRTELLRNCGVPYGELENRGVLFAIREMNVRYVSPAYYDEVLTVRTVLSDFRRASLRYDYVLSKPDGRVVAEGWTTLACINREGRPQAIPDFVRAAHGLA